MCCLISSTHVFKSIITQMDYMEAFVVYLYF